MPVYEVHNEGTPYEYVALVTKTKELRWYATGQVVVVTKAEPTPKEIYIM
jgi:hypothetical protein